jgi:hypothetical protein
MRQKNVLLKRFLVLSVLMALANPGLSRAGNLLCDGGFEQSEPNGGFPSSGCWLVNSNGAAGCAAFAARTANVGIFQYTGFALDQLQSQVYQEFPSAAGRRYFASVWARTSFAGTSWIDGSRVLLKVEFLDTAGSTLAEYNSIDIQISETDWRLLQVATNAAPAGTFSVRYSLIVEKPQIIGLTVAGFDDCILREYECADCLSLDEIPPCPGAMGQKLKGSVVGINSDDYVIGVYMFVDDWWPKPTFAQPWTAIEANGTWQCDIATSIYDLNATEVIAFLVPKNEISEWPIDFGIESGLAALPLEAFRFPSAGAFRPSCFTKKIQFAGYNWLVKNSGLQSVGPGPNIFDSNNAWVDANGLLHLKITNNGDKWQCAEVFIEDSSGGGTYSFAVDSNVSAMDANVVLGLFTWDEFAPQNANREMDIEISRWGDAAADNAQYVVQPGAKAGNLNIFNIDPCDQPVTHILDWRFGSADFESFYGLVPPAEQSDLIDSWTNTGSDVPRPGTENARINLWLDGGNPPADGCEVEVVIRNFEMNPCLYDVTPAQLDLESVLISGTASKPVTIANTGSCNPYMVTVDINGIDADYFHAADRAFSLEPGSSKQIDVTFTPDTNRVYEAMLEIKSHSVTVNVPLTGKGSQMEYTRVSAMGSPEFLEGRIAGLKFSDYRVVSYVYVFDRWYIKPLCMSNKSSTSPIVAINKYGDWKCNIDIEWTDKAATQVASFLIPKYADYPPCALDSLDDSRMSQYLVITADRPKLSISSIIATQGTTDGNDDSIVINGWYYITMSEALSAEQLCLSIRQQDTTLWTLCVPFNAEKFLSSDSFHFYRAGVDIQLNNQYQLLNSYSGKFRLTVRKTDLTCLCSPVTVAMELGDFEESAVADEALNEKIINGKKNIGINFLSGCTNALKINKLTLRRDYMKISGAIAFKNSAPNLTMEDLVIGWDSRTFAIPAGSFYKTSRTQPKYKCKKIVPAQGGLVDAYFDFKNGKFWVKIRKTKFNTSQDSAAFNIAMSNFSEGVLVQTN